MTRTIGILPKSGGGSETGTLDDGKTGMGVDSTINLDKSYALLVGVGRYAWADWSLPVTERDVKALKNVLIDPNYCGYTDSEEHVRLLTNENATRDNILSELSRLSSVARSSSDTTILVYFSGHGVATSQGHFLATHETSPSSNALEKSAISAEDFTLALRQIKAQRLAVILDTCHAEAMAEAKNLPSGEIYHHNPTIAFADLVEKPIVESLGDILREGRGRAVFTSCQGDQKSWFVEAEDLSIFTKHLIEGFKGAGTNPDDDVVRISDLMKYVSREVKRSASMVGHEQVPFYKLEATDFAMARARSLHDVPTGHREQEKQSREQTDSSSPTIGGRRRGERRTGERRRAERRSGDRRNASLTERLRRGLKLAYFENTDRGADDKVDLSRASAQGKMKDSLIREIARYKYVDALTRVERDPGVVLEECADRVFEHLGRSNIPWYKERDIAKTPQHRVAGVIEDFLEELMANYEITPKEQRVADRRKLDRRSSDRRVAEVGLVPEPNGLWRQEDH